MSNFDRGFGLSNCPFCKSSSCRLMDIYVGRAVYRIVCDHCGHAGPQFGTAQEAANAWNVLPRDENYAKMAYEKIGKKLMAVQSYIEQASGRRGFLSKLEIPLALSDIENISRFNIYDFCFVYFLMKGQQVVYVGRSGGSWPSRILSHVKKMDFDTAWYLEVERKSLNQTESYYIKKFNPQYNKIGKIKCL